MAYGAKAVANYFLDLAEANKTQLTAMKLQKLIFFAHGWHYAFYGEPLISEPVEAWQFGPVVSNVYHEFKEFGSGAITRKATEIDWEHLAYEEVPEPQDEQATKLLDQVWNSYSKLSAMQLSNLTHLADTPWDIARRENPGKRNVVISDELISSYFSKQLEKNKKKADEAA